MWVTVQVEDAAALCKGWQNCQAHKLKRYLEMDRNSNFKELSRNDKKQNPDRNDQCHFHATTETCKHAFGLWLSCINCNMQIVHLVFNHHVTITALCKVSTIQLSCINHYRLRAYNVNSCTNNNDNYMPWPSNMWRVSYVIPCTNNNDIYRPKPNKMWRVSGVFHTLRELPALIFRNWVHFKQIYAYMSYIIYVKYNYYTYILLKMQQTLSYLRLKWW